MGVRENLFGIRVRIAKARKNAPDPSASILLVGVTKGVSVARIREAVDCGLEIVGENRVQEAREKVSQLGEKVHWHMVGHLQTNKAKEAVRIFEWIHSLDSLSLAQTIEKEASLLGRQVPVLLQVNLVGEKTQFGLDPDAVGPVAKEVNVLGRLKLLGLMTIGPLVAEPEESRSTFRRLRQLQGALEKELQLHLPYLSMGMSNDFEVAIEEGANVLRIGRAIFGQR